MRIWHFLSGDLWAGAEVMACTLLKALRDQPDLELSVLLLNDGRAADELRGTGLVPVILDERRQRFPALVSAARRALAAAPPDLVHAHRYKENILAYLATRPGRKVPLVTTRHGLPETAAARWPGRLAAGLDGWLLAHRFSRVVAVAAPLRADYFRRLGIPPGRSLVIHNGIELPPPSDRPESALQVVGSAGRLVPVKDYPLLVAVAGAVTAAGVAAEFRLAGEGPQRARLEELGANSGLGALLQLLGEVADMDDFYRRLDLYLNTSRHEGLPMSVLEAMAHGLPVVAPDVGGLRELVSDGVDGFLVAGRDPRSFAEPCLKLLRDPELRRRMGRAARQTVTTRFSAAAMAAAYARLYREAVASPLTRREVAHA